MLLHVAYKEQIFFAVSEKKAPIIIKPLYEYVLDSFLQLTLRICNFLLDGFHK